MSLFKYNRCGVASYKGCEVVISRNSSGRFLGFVPRVGRWYWGKGYKHEIKFYRTEQECKGYIDNLASRFGYAE